MSSPKSIALLYQFKVSLNTNGELIVDWEGPPSSQEVVNAFDEWNEDYEQTKKIAWLGDLLRDSGHFHNNEIRRVLSA